MQKILISSTISVAVGYLPQLLIITASKVCCNYYTHTAAYRGQDKHIKSRTVCKDPQQNSESEIVEQHQTKSGVERNEDSFRTTCVHGDGPRDVRTCGIECILNWEGC